MHRKANQQTFCRAALAVLCLGWLTACGSGGNDYGSKPPDYERALAGAPRPLEKLYAQPNELLAGGTDAFQRRLAELRGYPVVVNKWASWCGPCRAEFPFFQRLTVKLGKRVAFLGVDSEDSDDAARTFLGEFPVAYPSYTDPDQKIAELLKATLGFPSTAFYDSSGKLAYTKQGGYANQRDLLADIRHFALGG
jgi:cytochrome c biogenesis protein CcmG, thiol:disulfide interchange protein DsbE